MMRFSFTSEKIPRTKRSLWIAGSGLLLVALLVSTVAGENGYLARRRQRHEIQALVEQIEKIEQENARLNQKIKDLRSDPHAIEKLARERLRLGRPGEVIVTLPPAQPSASPEGEDPASQEPGFGTR